MFLYPRISEIEIKKETLLETYEKFKSVSIKGVSFWDFKSSIRISETWRDAYTSNLMKNVTQDFFAENFTNSWSQDYSAYLNDIKQQVGIKKLSDEYIEKDKTLALILPIYDEKNTFSDEWLSDFFFINYIENILYSFNLSSNGEIWIWELEKQSWESEEQGNTDNLEEEIYRIPLVLEIVGQKRDVIDFLHYFENVGGISIQGDDLSIYKDTFINKKLEGSEQEIGYNIYKNQIADIDNIALQKYPDSSSLKTWWLIEAMRGEQGREKMSIEIELSFYVAWVPWYKMEKYIDDFLTLYQELSWNITLNTKKYTNQAYKFSSGEALLAINNLQSLDSVMLAFNDDVLEIRKWMVDKNNVPEVYKQVVEYRQQLSKIEENYNKQISTLTK